VEVGEQPDDRLAGTAVEVSGGLVGEHDRRVGDQRSSDRHSLALAAGQLAGPVVGALGEADGGEGFPGPAHPAPAGDTGVEQPVGDVLQCRQALDEVELLEHEADPPCSHRGQPGISQ
jgi:hypothetical protein